MFRSWPKFRLTEDGYAMPLELWVQAVRLGLRIVEVAVPLIYLDERRSFGGALDQADTRLRSIAASWIGQAEQVPLEPMTQGPGRSLANRRFAAPRENPGRLGGPAAGRRSAGLVAANVRAGTAGCYAVARPVAGRTRRSGPGRPVRPGPAMDGGLPPESSRPPTDPRGLIFLAGHQPELFHPGVWFKNFALGDLARRYQATAVNLVIDSDTVKSTVAAGARRHRSKTPAWKRSRWIGRSR